MRKLETKTIKKIFDKVLTKLEAFGEDFLYLATTDDQRDLAVGFNDYVEEIIQALQVPSIENEHLAPTPEEQAFHKQQGHETLADLFAELRADEAAAKREDAHWYGRLSLKALMSGWTEAPATEKGNDKDIER